MWDEVEVEHWKCGNYGLKRCEITQALHRATLRLVQQGGCLHQLTSFLWPGALTDALWCDTSVFVSECVCSRKRVCECALMYSACTTSLLSLHSRSGVCFPLHVSVVAGWRMHSVCVSVTRCAGHKWTRIWGFQPSLITKRKEDERRRIRVW